MGNPQMLAFYITVSCIAFVISKIIISILLYKRWKRKHLVYEDDFSGGKMVMFRSPIMQSLKSDAFLKKTLKLSNKDIIGSGGYGTVYKLTVSDSTAFAVKRLNRGTAERDRGFERELEAMGDIKHRNIVTLHGYYTAPHYNLLIYELMPNGSLDTFLHDEAFIEEGTKLVTWVKTVVEQKREDHVLDSNLECCTVDENEINSVFNIALICLEPEPSKRPSMAEVVKMLEQIKITKFI
ncbi:hypothetical protein FEM48_Zijuj12G0123900 [Ziziphus jujuba var. spinosa]|uniref:Protein kinase domain-containing protein n=1 Tax=Ziziphus jujuba var. spinosa TaxID=714518 RepID=A0A978UDB1_ZIZJJ|nr:hypothetical protein FEM48_Zijuj12G0123900 [Ziziphus jujuba var. spinosa]